MELQEATIRQFWKCFDAAEFDAVRALMHPQFTAWMPNTRERYPDAESFIAFNKAYPGRWHVALEQLRVVAEEVITVVRVYNPEMTASFHAISFFYMEDGLIKQLTEYWSEDLEPPDWRKSLNIVQEE